MNRRSRRVVLGSLLVVLALVSSACSPFDGAAPSFEVELARAHNLFPGSDVKVLGVPVGRVQSVTAPEGAESALVTLRLRRGTELPADVEAHIVQGTLLGERFVQLHPPYTGGESLAAGSRIPLERSTVPTEFDELLTALDELLSALPPEELDRFVRNAAETLEGRGEELGRTLETVADAASSLRHSDDELVGLLVGLADLTETLGTRDAELRSLLGDYAELTSTLAAERDGIDLALAGTAAFTAEVADLLREHGERLGASAEVVTRVTRTLDRNHTELRRTVHGQAELFRHAERVFDLERNWLPLINHAGDLPRITVDRLATRLAGLCERAGIEGCDTADFWAAQLPAELCLDPVMACDRGDGLQLPTLVEALEQAVELEPALVDAIEEASEPTEPEPEPEEERGFVERVLEGLFRRGAR